MADLILADPEFFIILFVVTLANLGFAWVSMRYAKLAQAAANLAIGLKDGDNG